MSALTLPHLTRLLRPGLALTALLGVVGTAHAHTGHDTTGLLSGLAHPLGADHLLAMVAVGMWSAVALPTNRAWQGPATFMLALLCSAALGLMGLQMPYVEHAIAASVVLFGLMLCLSTTRQAPSAAQGLGLIALAASLHGVAHGAEVPQAAHFGAYAVGFLCTTSVLHGLGWGMGTWLQRAAAQAASTTLRAIGALLSVTGLYFLTQAI